MPSNFPSGTDTLNDHHQDNVGEIVHAPDVNAIADAVMAIEGAVSATAGATKIPLTDNTGKLGAAWLGTHSHTEDFLRTVAFPAPIAGDTATIAYIPAGVTITAIRVLLTGGTSCAVNVIKDGSLNLLASDLSSSTTGAWASTTTIQNGSLASGDWLTAKVTAATGNPSEICVEIEGTKQIS